MIGSILKLLAAIPGLIKGVTALYDKMRAAYIDKKTKQAVEAVDEAIKNEDQTDLETKLGSENAGKPTRHNIPGLRVRERKNNNKS